MPEGGGATRDFDLQSTLEAQEKKVVELEKYLISATRDGTAKGLRDRRSAMPIKNVVATDTIEVNKTDDAEMDADPKAKSINIRSKSAFQRKRRYFSYNGKRRPINRRNLSNNRTQFPPGSIGKEERNGNFGFKVNAATHGNVRRSAADDRGERISQKRTHPGPIFPLRKAPKISEIHFSTTFSRAATHLAELRGDSSALL